LIDVTVEDVMKALDDGLFTSVELTRAYLARIDEVNPQFNAVTEVNPDALDIAAQLDNERAEGNSRG
jgi:amidase